MSDPVKALARKLAEHDLAELKKGDDLLAKLVTATTPQIDEGVVEQYMSSAKLALDFTQTSRPRPKKQVPQRLTGLGASASYRESHDSVTFTIPRPTTVYMDEWVRLRCTDDMKRFGLFPNSKEVTESFAAFHAARKFVMTDEGLKDPNWTVIVVGDGATPRTGATFAFRSKASAIISVDPQMREHPHKGYEPYNRISRLYGMRGPIEDLPLIGPSLAPTKVLIVAVHSHANLKAAVNAVKQTYLGAAEMHVVAIPCCEVQDIDPARTLPWMEYDDWGIWSGDRHVMIWKYV